MQCRAVVEQVGYEGAWMVLGYDGAYKQSWLLVRPLASVPVLCGAAGAGEGGRGRRRRECLLL